MNKSARKSSTDPIQEKLRQHKAEWNKGVSAFIGDLINLKRLMNGAPSKFHMEKGNIKEPIPADPVTILGSLAGDFQEIAQKGNALIEEQIEYSKKRRKTQPKVPNGPVTESAPVLPSGPNLTQQLSAASLEFMFLAEGSTPVSRFYSSLKGPWFGDSTEARNRKYRISLLKACADLNRQLKRFEAEIMGSSPETIFSASKLLVKLRNQFAYIVDTLASSKLSLKVEPENQDNETIPETHVEDPAIVEAKKFMMDFRKSVANFNDLDPVLIANVNQAMKMFIDSSADNRLEFASKLIEAYKELLNDANTKHSTTANSLTEILMNKSASVQIEKIAQNFLTKWLGKLKHQLTPWDKTSALRLDLVRVSKECRDILNEIMNSLEKQIDHKSLSTNLTNLSRNLIAMEQLMKPLETTIRGNLFDKTFVNMLRDRKITDLDYDLNKEQERHLERLFERRQFRDLADMYSGK